MSEQIKRMSRGAWIAFLGVISSLLLIAFHFLGNETAVHIYTATIIILSSEIVKND